MIKLNKIKHKNIIYFIITFIFYCNIAYTQVNPNINFSQLSPISSIDQSAATLTTPVPTPDQTISLSQRANPVPEPTQPSVPVSPQISPTTPPIQGAELVEIKEIKDDQEAATIYLNFDNTSLLSIVNYLGEQKKINLIPHKDLEAAKVSLSTRTPITLERAWNILLTLLEMNGFSIIKVGPLYRVVLSKDNGFEPLPTFSSETGTNPEALPDSDLIVRYIYFFKNIKVDLAQNILKTMIDEKGIITNKDLNACIIKDQCFNLKAAFRILKELDMGGLSEQIKIIPLRYANVDAVYAIFKEILNLEKEEKIIRFGATSQQERAYFSSSTRIYPDANKNALILLGTEQNLNKITDFIYKNIDVPLGKAESRLHIYELRYANAEQLKPILDGILRPPTGVGSEKTAVVGEYKFFEDVIISAEKTGSTDGAGDRGGGNRLIIACNKDDWKRLLGFILKLDKPQPQIAIEVLMVNTQAEEIKQLGAQTWNFKGKTPGLGIERAAFNNLNSGQEKTKKVPQEDGTSKDVPVQVASYVDLAQTEYEGTGNPTFITLGRASDGQTGDYIWSLIKARLTTNNSHVVAQPYLVTNNNKECTVEVNTSALIAGGLQSTKGESSVQKKVNVTAKTAVKIKPRINLNGIVELEITIDLNEFEGTISDEAKILERSIITRATLYTGEVLVLGGLTKNEQLESTWKTPLLGDIPLLGNLFKNKTKTTTATNLYVFIRPSIIKPRFEGSPDEYTQLKLDYAKYQMMKNDTYVKDRDPIQRWFFKPLNQDAKQALADRNQGLFRPIDDLALGKETPKTVLIQQDPYYKVSEALKTKPKKKKKPVQEQVATTIKLS